MAAVMIVTAVLAASVLCSSAAAASWKVSFEGSDITGPAAPIDRRDAPLVNVVTMGPAIALAANVLDNQLEITDAAGTVWKASSGDISLCSDTAALPLKSAVIVQGSTAYLPVDALAEVAGLKLEIDSVARTVAFSARGSSEKLADGWEALVMPKPAEARAKPSALGNGPATPKAFLPPSHDRLRTSIGLGYVQGTDFGTELLAFGKFRGVSMQFGMLATYGSEGLRPSSGLLQLKDNECGWLGEGGGLFSEIFGTAYGVRYAHRFGRDHWPALSLYVSSPNSNLGNATLALRDEVQLTKTLAIGGEVASNSSYFGKIRLLPGRFSLHAYGRSSPRDEANGMGFFASYDIGKGLYLFGGASRSASGANSTGWRSISLRAPLTRQIGLTLEHTLNLSDTANNTISALMADFPLGPVRLLTRYQFRGSSLPSGTIGPASSGSNSQQLQASVVYFANPILSLDYQMSTYWFGNGNSQNWQQLVGSIRLSNRTQLQAVMGMPNMLDSQRFRMRLNHELNEDMSVYIDYGQLMPFQGASISPDEKGVMVMLRRQFNVPTPARGGTVTGTVVDQLGRAVPGVVVTLNQYRVVTDKSGHFKCYNLPSGSYDVCMASDCLPADYKCDMSKQKLVVGPQTKRSVELQLVPLNSLSGRVYVDANKNGEFDIGEGISGVAVELGGSPTASRADGSFGFYNLEPAKHVVKLLADRLPPDLALDSPVEVETELKPDVPVTGLEFRLVKREKNIIFQNP